MNAPTKALTELVLMDSAKIAAEDATDTLYTEDDVQSFLKKVQIVDYHVPFTVGDFRLTMYDAGHIIGSSSILVEEISSSKKIVFCGDLGNTPEPLLLPTETFKEADFTLLESTYGDEVHGIRNEADRIAEIVQEAERVGGVVMIPTFSIERAQEVLYLFDQLKKEKKVREDTPVFLDSPMAIKATEIFKDYPEYFNKKLKDQVKSDDPFDFPGLVVCDSVEKSKQIKNYSGTKVIVAGSGMMTGGRIIHHAINYLEDPKAIIVFVGFQAVGTLGRQIKDGEKNISIWGNHIEVRAQIEEIKSMSSHADQEQLMSWVGKIKGLKKIILIHGEDLPRLVLKEKIKNELGDIDVIMPNLNMQIEL
jgi:metallo-beta-lactamase family protein